MKTCEFNIPIYKLAILFSIIIFSPRITYGITPEEILSRVQQQKELLKDMTATMEITMAKVRINENIKSNNYNFVFDVSSISSYISRATSYKTSERLNTVIKKTKQKNYLTFSNFLIIFMNR